MLVNLAEQCNAVLPEWEKATLGTSSQGAAALPDIFPRDGESGTLRLVRTACKALQKHGSEQSGRPEDFAAFCTSKNIEIPLATFCRNRLNILFFNATGVYFLSSTMKEFFFFHTTNRLLQAVAADIEGGRIPGGLSRTWPHWEARHRYTLAYLVQSSSYFADVVVVVVFYAMQKMPLHLSAALRVHSPMQASHRQQCRSRRADPNERVNDVTSPVGSCRLVAGMHSSSIVLGK